jgi:hypothetical protein
VVLEGDREVLLAGRMLSQVCIRNVDHGRSGRRRGMQGGLVYACCSEDGKGRTFGSSSAVGSGPEKNVRCTGGGADVMVGHPLFQAMHDHGYGRQPSIRGDGKFLVTENAAWEVYGRKWVLVGYTRGDTVEEGVVEGWRIGETVDARGHAGAGYETRDSGVRWKGLNGHAQTFKVQFGEDMGGYEVGANGSLEEPGKAGREGGVKSTSTCIDSSARSQIGVLLAVLVRGLGWRVGVRGGGGVGGAWAGGGFGRGDG